jgi:sortase (surface protein transpeptidase)
MDMTYIYLAIGAAVVFFILGVYLRIKGKKELLEEQATMQASQPVVQQQQAVRNSAPKNPEMVRLQLQAYERLIILVERIGLGNIIGRLSANDLSAQQFQSSLIQNIKQEYEYNVSQQLYVSPTAWDAVKNLKEQNIFIINQIAAMLPANAPAAELNKKIAELLSQDENASLQNIVAALLQKEAKELMS